MTEKDFANMSLEELKAHCENLQKELDTAQWFLRRRKTAEAGRTRIKADNPDEE